MKTIKNYLFVLLVALTSIFAVSCSEDSSLDKKVDPLKDKHFDVWVTIGGSGGMGSEDAQLVQGINSLEAQDEIDFQGTGTDVTAKLYQESIIKGKYYYQVPKENDRFGKYQVVNGEIKVIKEFKFENITLKARKYTHAWINDRTLVLIASNGVKENSETGDESKVFWIKVDTEEMKILGEGELILPKVPEGDRYSTSGIANYREDGKIMYAYLHNYSKTHFFVAFVDAETMKVEGEVAEEKRAEFMAGTAYGELLQRKTFFDEKGDYYIACNSLLDGHTSRTQQRGTLVRIKKGEKNFDQSYKGFNFDHGKLVTVDYLNNEKVLLYIQDPEVTGADWGKNFNCYYAVLDLASDKLTKLDLPYSAGTFSQRSIVMGDKAYIGVNPEEGSPAVYVYDIETGAMEKGLTIQEGYSFDRIVNLHD